MYGDMQKEWTCCSPRSHANEKIINIDNEDIKENKEHLKKRK